MPNAQSQIQLACPGHAVQWLCNELSCTTEIIQSKPAQLTAARESEISLQVAGFVGLGFPEYLVKALRKRFDSTQHPQNLHIVAVAACGDGKGRGLDELAVDGLVSTATFGWAGLSPKLLKMIIAKKIYAWNLPLGVGRHLSLLACCHSLTPQQGCCITNHAIVQCHWYVHDGLDACSEDQACRPTCQANIQVLMCMFMCCAGLQCHTF